MSNGKKRDYAREIRQAAIDDVVRRTLERSGLIKPAAPLRRQIRNKCREAWIEGLFLVACAEAEGR